MAYRMFLRQGVAAIVFSAACFQATASVVITGTRLIYPANEKEITVILNNNGELPVLVQTWIDSGKPDSSPNTATSPFVLSPPVFRMDPHAVQNLRMIFTGATLPADKESVYWFNLLEVPSSPATADVTNSMLQMAFRSRIKVFYRPESLTGNVSNVLELLQWKVVRRANDFVLEGYNPSAFHITVTGVAVVDNEQRFAGTGEMIAPQTTHQFLLPTLKKLPGPNAQVEFIAINDYGADEVIKRSLTP
jgi:chaperone protein EcpD